MNSLRKPSHLAASVFQVDVVVEPKKVVACSITRRPSMSDAVVWTCLSSGSCLAASVFDDQLWHRRNEAADVDCFLPTELGAGPRAGQPETRTGADQPETGLEHAQHQDLLESRTEKGARPAQRRVGQVLAHQRPAQTPQRRKPGTRHPVDIFVIDAAGLGAIRNRVAA